MGGGSDRLMVERRRPKNSGADAKTKPLHLDHTNPVHLMVKFRDRYQRASDVAATRACLVNDLSLSYIPHGAYGVLKETIWKPKTPLSFHSAQRRGHESILAFPLLIFHHFRCIHPTPPTLTMPPPTSRPDIAPPAVLSPIAYKAFAVGALRFGSISLFTHILLHRFHPTYRRLTPQFKAFIQISTMTLGGCIYAERGVSEFNEVVRRKNRAMERARRVSLSICRFFELCFLFSWGEGGTVGWGR